MDKETFDRILVEEGVDEAALREDLWHSRPANGLDDEQKLRKTAKWFKEKLPALLTRQALNKAMNKEFGRS